MARLYPVDHPLGSAATKLDRADLHLRDIVSQVRDALADDSVAQQDKPKRTLVRPESTIPDDWAGIIGDTLSNLRSSLDHIAWALVHRQWQITGVFLSKEARRIVFPLNDPVGDYPPKWIKWLLPTSHVAVEEFQPYNRTKRPELELLGILQEFSNADKHRTVRPIVNVSTITLGSGQSLSAYFDPDEGPTSMSSVSIIGGSNSDVEPQTTTDVVVRSQKYRNSLGVSIVSEFPLIYDLIRDEIFPRFARIIEQSY